MYFWKTELLADDLKNERLSSVDEFCYFLIFNILSVIALFAMFLPSPDFPTLEFVDVLLGSLIYITGLCICYRTNSSGDGSSFTVRFVSLGLPLCIRYAVRLGVALIIAALFVRDSFLFDLISVFFSNVFLLVWMFRLNLWMKYISSKPI
ncbi:MAG: hypothetical protein KAG61_14325 [Bacteriovoracaceae bacterium]|nr:hypothetical protein [Bacteriovoracaceae bacterium]